MAYTTPELVSTGSGPAALKRVYPKNIQAKTFAAGSGTIPICTPVAFNTSTLKWTVWAKSAAVNEVSTLTATGTVSGGNYTLTVNGETTANIAHNASNATILAELEKLGGINPGDVVVGGGALPGTPVTLTWGGQWAGKAITVAVNSSVTGGGTLTLAETTAGASANGIDQIRGFVWPDPIVLSGTGEVIGQVLLAGNIHFDDIAKPSAESVSDLKDACRVGPRTLGLFIEGLDQVR